MRGLKLLIAGLLIAGMAMAQYVQPMGYKDYSFYGQMNIGNAGTKVTHPSAYLELGLPSGSTRGMLLPRGVRGNIISPAEGLIMYDLVDKETFFFNGSSWVSSRASGKLDSVRLRGDSVFYYKNGGTEFFAGKVKGLDTTTADSRYIKNGTTPQTGSFDITGTAVVGGEITASAGIRVGDFVTNPPVVNGKIIRNSSSGKVLIGEDGIWKGVFEQQTISGKTILVDKSNPNATDTRGALSKYNQTYPWKTVNAAIQAVAAGDDVRVKGGAYAEIAQFSGTFPNGITMIFENSSLSCLRSNNVGLNVSGVGYSAIDTIYYGNSAQYSNLTSIKVVKPAAGGSSGYFRNIYSIDSVDGAANAVELYNINNIRAIRMGSATKVYNSRISNTIGDGVAVRNASGVTASVNDCALVECYVYGSTYGVHLGNLSAKIKILDSEVYGGVHTIYSGDGFTATPTLRIMNTLLRSGTGDAVRAGYVNHTITLETSNVTRTGGYGGTGTFTYAFQNNDVQYSGL